MNWHYEKNGSPIGPVTDAQLATARTSGEIQGTTRVWREGWADWKIAAEVWPGSLPAGAPALARCVECGAPHADLITLSGLLVCPECKPRALAKLREGVAIGTTGGFAGPWRDGKLLVVSKNSPLPDCCIKCGAPPAKLLRRTLSWHHPALYLIIFIGLLIYLIVAMIVRKTAKLQVPVCARCNSKRLRNIAIGWLSFFASIALFYLGGSNMDTNETLGTTLLISGGVLILFCLIWAVAVQFILAKKITDQFVWITKVGKKTLEPLPQFPGV